MHEYTHTHTHTHARTHARTHAHTHTRTYTRTHTHAHTHTHIHTHTHTRTHTHAHTHTQDVMEEWALCQRSWLYLEPIFSSEDIMRQLPVEGKRYQTMDRMWRKIMLAAKNEPKVISFCSDNRLLENFRECNKLLDQVQKGLSDYLETKRMSFPRFYFLSDDELLEILSQTKDPTAVQPHLRKCFENIAKVHPLVLQYSNTY